MTEPNDGPLGERGGRLARLSGLQLADLATRLQDADVEALSDSFAALAREIEELLAIDPGRVDPAVRLTFVEWEAE